MAGEPVTFVTSWGPGGWDLYARRFVNSFLAYFPPGSKLVAFYHDHLLPVDAPNDPRIEYRSLDNDIQYRAFKVKYGHANGKDANGQYNYRFDALKFCNKIFAMYLAERGGWTVWLDADTFAQKDIPQSFFDGILSDSDIVWLDRTDIDYAETSFFAVRPASFIAEAWHEYVSGAFLNYTEWHDGFVLTRLVKERPGRYRVKNLSEGCTGLEAFRQSPLAEYMDHLKGNLKYGAAPEKGPAPFRVRPVDVAPKDELLANVKTNMELVELGIRQYLPHSGRVVIVGGGPSAEALIDAIKFQYDDGAMLVCVKHSLPLLRRHGIEPHYCVVLDPRTVEGESTHGLIRKDLYGGYAGSVEFLVASMTNPDTTRHLNSLNAKVRLWHAFTQTLLDAKILPEGTFMVAGGTCAALRAVGLMHAFGFRRFDVYGVDASQGAEPSAEELAKQQNGMPKWFRVGTDPDPEKGRKWWTTGELVALAQDVDELARREGLDIEINWHGESLAKEMWDIAGRQNLPEYHGV